LKFLPAEGRIGSWFELRDQALEEDEMYGVVSLRAPSCWFYCARDINTMRVLPIWEEYETQATMAL
jgi:hypothetical protein